MSDIALLRTLLLAGEAVAASVAVPAAALLIARACPRSAGRRRQVFIAAFALLLVLPVLSAITPSLATIELASPAAVAASTRIAVETPQPWSALILPGLIIAAAVVWMLGAVAIVLRGLIAALALERVRRCATRSTPDAHGLPAGGYELRFSEDCPGPLTWGVLRPVILMPWAALDWPLERLEPVLRHELAHVRRRDGLAQALSLLACALYWPNPLVWSARRALRREAEAAADDAVIASGVRPSDYAALLLELARQWRGEDRASPSLAMAAPAALTERVQSILSPDAVRTGATTMDTLKLTLIGGLAATALLAVRPSLAETVLTLAPDRLTPAVAAPPPPLPAPAAPTLAAPAPPPAPKAPRRTVVVDGGKVAAEVPAQALSPEDKADLDRQLAEIGPTVKKALADAHIQETVAREIAAQQERTHAEVARQLAEIGPKIQKAMADARIEERVAQHLAEAQTRIDAAAARAGQRATEAEARAKKAEADAAVRP